jgi:hypothetical protein
VPLSAPVYVPAPLLLTFRVAVFDPIEVGLNTRLIVQFDPTATGLAQVLVCENWPGFLPENVMLVIDNATAHELSPRINCLVFYGPVKWDLAPTLAPLWLRHLCHKRSMLALIISLVQPSGIR